MRVGARLPDRDLAGTARRTQSPGFRLPLDDALPLHGQSRCDARAQAAAPPVVRQAQRRHRAAARNHLPAGSPLVDSDAANKAADADAALQELGSDEVAFGYVTATVTVMDRDATAADEKPTRGRARDPGARLRHDPGDAEQRRGLALLASGPRLRQRAPADRLHPESRAPDAAVRGMGRARSATRISTARR